MSALGKVQARTRSVNNAKSAQLLRTFSAYCAEYNNAYLSPALQGG
jgi:hypothetical protein